MKKKIIIIDGNSLAYSNVPNPEKVNDKFMYSTPDREDIYIVRKFIKKILRYKYIVFSDYQLAVVFDERDKVTFRHKMDDKYKVKKLNEKRVKQKEYVYDQIDSIKLALDKMNIPHYSSRDWEADDIIGMLVNKLEKKGFLSTIVTGDKDILQLISQRTRIEFNDPNGKSVLTDRSNVWDITGGVWPDQVIDIKIIAGDSSDNIKGIGLLRDGRADYWTTAEAYDLVSKYNSIDGIIKNLSKIKEPYKRSLERALDKIEHNRKLVTIVQDWSLDDIDYTHFINKNINTDGVEKEITRLNLEELLSNKRFKQTFKKQGGGK